MQEVTLKTLQLCSQRENVEKPGEAVRTKKIQSQITHVPLPLWPINNPVARVCDES